MEKKLYKSNQNKMIDGVCGGIAEYFGIDPTVVRLIWALFSLMGGSGILAYIIAAIIIDLSCRRNSIKQPRQSFVTVAAICICYIEALSVMSASRTSSGTVFHSPFL